MAYKCFLNLGAAAIVLAIGVMNSTLASAQTSKDADTAGVAKDQKAADVKITDRSHPDYKRCRREAVIGSRARIRSICMTNRQWEEYARAGNSGARSILDDVGKGGMRQE